MSRTRRARRLHQSAADRPRAGRSANAVQRSLGCNARTRRAPGRMGDQQRTCVDPLANLGESSLPSNTSPVDAATSQQRIVSTRLARSPGRNPHSSTCRRRRSSSPTVSGSYYGPRQSACSSPSLVSWTFGCTTGWSRKKPSSGKSPNPAILAQSACARSRCKAITSRTRVAWRSRRLPTHWPLRCPAP